MQKYTLTVPDNLPDMTLDKYLAHALPLLPERARRGGGVAGGGEREGKGISKRESGTVFTRA